MADVDVCPICNSTVDDWSHALINCNMVKCVWSLLEEDLVEHVIACNIPDAKLWLLEMVDSTKEEEFLKILVTLWATWWVRRKAIHEQEYQSPLSTYCFTEKYLNDLALISAKEEKPPAVVPSRMDLGSRRTWAPPVRGCAKLMVDAAISKNHEKGAYAVVCRDEKGVYQGASAVVVEDQVTAEILEALALASDLNRTKV
ncbi:uncharacterized protein [Aegilops tauschii subsp. strangulata]|uniref:uncharacterized protein n=1 Tax=Aegilops tauschii subsp. strangulata TaxID=200361 RepID=UPI001ABBF599|nr:uncharacterized protein LOC120976068 [Aegilops tauschii subsp. strangulata]